MNLIFYPPITLYFGLWANSQDLQKALESNLKQKLERKFSSCIILSFLQNVEKSLNFKQQ